MPLKGVLMGVCGGRTYATPPSWVGSGGVVYGSGAIDVTVPGDYQAGDFLLLQLGGYNATPDAPDGWTSIETKSTYTAYQRVCYKFSAASESAVTVADTGSLTMGCMYAYRGVYSSSPIATSTTNIDDNTTFSANQVTTPFANCMIVILVAFNDYASANDSGNYSSWTNDNLASVTEAADQFIYLGSSARCGLTSAYGVKAAAGATGATTATTDASTNVSASITLALAPAV